MRMHKVKPGWYALPVAEKHCFHVYRRGQNDWVFGTNEVHWMFDPMTDVFAAGFASKAEAVAYAKEHLTRLRWRAA